MSTAVNLMKNESINTQKFLLCSKEPMPAPKFKSNVWQILPAVIGSLTCVPFGIMLGWPSPTYPKLLDDSSPIPITIDQSAMIAGFLMIGNIVGTPFSSWSFLGTKYGMVLGIFVMLLGWIIMYFANSIYFLLASRLVVGLGFGYGVGQLKTYIKDLCHPGLAKKLTNLITFYVFLGVIAAFILGYFLTFTDFSLVAITTTGIIMIFIFLLPHTPKEYLKFGKARQARKILHYISPNTNVEEEIQHLNIIIRSPESKNLTILQVVKERGMRKKFAIIALLTFFMQFSGAPSTIVYSQIIFSASGTPFPEFCAMFYSVLFFFSNFSGVFFLQNFNRKCCLLLSSIVVALTSVLNVAVFYLDFNENYWNYSVLISMSLYVFFHSIGLAVVPFVLTQEYFPDHARRAIAHFQIMQHSALALIITKIFQVFYDRYGLYVPFSLYACISLVASIFILVLVPCKDFPEDLKNIRIKLPSYS